MSKTNTVVSVAMDEILVTPEFQSRKDLSPDRVDQFAAVYGDKKKVKPPAVRLMRINEEASRHHDKLVMYGGFHRYGGADKAGLKHIDAIVTEGTWADALRAAALENIEHDTAGMPRTNADKQRSAFVYASSYKDVVEKDRPSYRKMADILGLSHQYMNNADFFGRGKLVPKEERGIIKDRSVDANGQKKKKVKKKPEAFAWVTLDEKFSYCVRSLDVIAENFGIDKNGKDFNTALDGFSMAQEIIKKWMKEHGVKKMPDGKVIVVPPRATATPTKSAKKKVVAKKTKAKAPAKAPATNGKPVATVATAKPRGLKASTMPDLGEEPATVPEDGDDVYDLGK